MGIPPSLLRRIKDDTPKMNPDVANGLATKLVPLAEGLIDSIWRTAAKGFPPGLTYDGCRRCTPQEEFFHLNRRKGDRLIVEIAKNDVYAMRFDFSYHGERIKPCYAFLPFVGDAGSLTLSGATYFVAPVASDIVLSFESDNVFVKLLRDKFTIRRINHDILIDKQLETVSVVRSRLYHSNTRNSKVDGECALAHYLFCKYGVQETFRRFTGCSPIVINSDIDDVSKYESKDYVIVQSTGFIQNKALGEQGCKTPLLMIFKRQEFTPVVKSLAAGFYYVVDKYPTRVSTETCMWGYDPDGTAGWIWRVLLGINIFGEGVSEGKLHDDATEHIKSLDEYIDFITQNRLRQIGVVVTDIYEFFATVIEKFDDWIMLAVKTGSSIYHKELAGLLDLISPITIHIFKLYYELNKKAKKDLRRQLTVKDIEDAFKAGIKPRNIFKLVKQINGVNNVNYSGDNKCLKLTSIVVPQKSINGVSDKDHKKDDPMERLDVSFAEVGSFLILSRSAPIGIEKINPYVQLDSSGKIIRNQDKRAALDATQEMLKRTSYQAVTVE